MVSVSAQTPDYTQQLRDIDNSLTLLNNTLGNIYNPAGPLLSEAEFDYRTAQLVNILSYGQSVGQNNNILSILKSINSRILQSADILASNPWWATNSAFVLTASNYRNAFPDDGRNLQGAFSFPQFMSKWSAKFSAPYGSGSLTHDSAYSLWGLDSFRDWGSSDQQGYTWFDWMADAMRSNIQQVASSQLYPSQSEASNSVAALYDSYSEEFSTNAVPETPEFEVEVRHVTGFNSISSPMEDFISDLQPPSTGGDSEIVVLPSFDLGGIHTQQYKFDFDTSITPYCRGIMSFIWAVMGGCMIFRLLSGEWAFYTSLGRSTR